MRFLQACIFEGKDDFLMINPLLLEKWNGLEPSRQHQILYEILRRVTYTPHTFHAACLDSFFATIEPQFKFVRSVITALTAGDYRVASETYDQVLRLQDAFQSKAQVLIADLNAKIQIANAATTAKKYWEDEKIGLLLYSASQQDFNALPTSVTPFIQNLIPLLLMCRPQDIPKPLFAFLLEHKEKLLCYVMEHDAQFEARKEDLVSVDTAFGSLMRTHRDPWGCGMTHSEKSIRQKFKLQPPVDVVKGLTWQQRWVVFWGTSQRMPADSMELEHVSSFSA